MLSDGHNGTKKRVDHSLPPGSSSLRPTTCSCQFLCPMNTDDSRCRTPSVNLKGGPAMPLREWAAWKQKGLLGASLKIVAAREQYDPARVINWGVNRWAFKPEIG